MTIEEYISQFKGIAMEEMKRTGVPASITLAQGILESENGNSELVKKSNNHFGIKCKTTWTGQSVTHDDDAIGECFRAYANAEDSYKDHSDFLRGNKRYSFLFNYRSTDYEAWANGLKKAGYATNPRYPVILIKYIEQYNLQQYSLAVIDSSQKNISVNTVEDNVAKSPVEISSTGINIKEIKNTNGEKPFALTSINNIKCVFVKKGVSLLVVANNNKISLSKLMEFNDMSDEGILDKDQYVFLQKKSKIGPTPTYVVLQGETLQDISQKNAIQLKYLLEYNNLQPSVKLKEGIHLIMQPKLTPVSLHIVAPKEGLYSIAKKFDVTIQQLKDWNKLTTNELKVGQVIKVAK